MTALSFTTVDVARVVHEALTAIQVIHSDPAPSPHWDDATPDTQESCIEGVRDAMSANTPEELHDGWCEHLRRRGWVYGDRKDASAKTHPCLVPFDELDPYQQVKSRVFVAIVKAIREARREPAVRGPFTCPRCGRTSQHPNDVAEGYCGGCHDWTGQPT